MTAAHGHSARLIIAGVVLSMGDRVSAVGGTVADRSSPGRGTHVVATIPIDGFAP